MIKLKIKISSRKLMLTESVDFFSFFDDDDDISKHCFVLLPFALQSKGAKQACSKIKLRFISRRLFANKNFVFLTKQKSLSIKNKLFL